MIENVSEITKEQLIASAECMLRQGYRFITATCVDLGNNQLEVMYHFDKELALANFRVHVSRGEDLPSISRVFFSALLIENEMKELFGLNVTNIAIDFGGHLLLTPDDMKHPMAKTVAAPKSEVPA